MRLERAEVHRVRWPLADAGGAARGHWRERSGAVLVVHGEGRRGLGEASPLPGHGVGADDEVAARATAELERFARALPLTIAATRPRLAAAALVAGIAEPSARFAVETAILDLVAGHAGVPLAALLVEDGATPSTSVAASRVIDDVDGALAAWSSGFRTLKLKGRDGSGWEPAAIRRAVPDARLRVDVNQGWDLLEVDRRLATLADLALEYVEEPALDLAPLLTGPRACALALDESLTRVDRDDWLDRALASGALAALVLKPTVLGGLAACLGLAARARARGVDAVISHALEGPVALAALAELARAVGGPRAHGVDVHAGLAAWKAVPAQLAGARVHAAVAPGLGFA